MEAFIYDAVRTPRGKGKADGSLHSVEAVDLLKTVLTNIRKRNNLDTALIDDVIMGCVTPIGEQGADIARAAVLHAGYAESVAGVTLNRFCSSGLEAINMAAAYVMSGQVDLLVAGGVESMSRVAMGSDGGALWLNKEIINQHKIVPQGISADLIATQNGFSRQDVDKFAAESYRRATVSQAENRFHKSLVPVFDAKGNILLNRDEGVRPGTTFETLSNLRASFQAMGDSGLDAIALSKYPSVSHITHVHHAGNSSQIVDGAAGLLIGNKAIGKKMGIKPRAKIKAFAIVGSEPTIMLTGVIPATKKVLKKAGISINVFANSEAYNIYICVDIIV